MKMKKYNHQISQIARELTGQHIRFLANVSPDAARKLNDAISSTIRAIRTNPFQFPIWQSPIELPHEYRKAVVNKHHLILYFVEGNFIHIDYIFDTRMDNTKWF